MEKNAKKEEARKIKVSLSESASNSGLNASVSNSEEPEAEPSLDDGPDVGEAESVLENIPDVDEENVSSKETVETVENPLSTDHPKIEGRKSKPKTQKIKKSQSKSPRYFSARLLKELSKRVGKLEEKIKRTPNFDENENKPLEENVIEANQVTRENSVEEMSPDMVVDWVKAMTARVQQFNDLAESLSGRSLHEVSSDEAASFGTKDVPTELVESSDEMRTWPLPSIIPLPQVLPTSRTLTIPRTLSLALPRIIPLTRVLPHSKDTDTWNIPYMDTDPWEVSYPDGELD